MRHNTIERAIKVRELVKEHYEEGRQDRCKLWVFRHIIVKQYPMSVRTFYRYLSMNIKENKI
ncbi:hypothetical protein EZS27_010051 [termite gut metagenome]|uniref:Uncharacterized protein n=1 Tax=termite gut metagenome TaxID=433724 RepID=A0A5J4S7Y0_9ZZZZ